MRRWRYLVLVSIGVLSTVCLVVGWRLGQWPLLLAGSAGGTLAGVRLATLRRKARSPQTTASGPERSRRPPAGKRGAALSESDSLVAEMLAQGRVTLLLRPQIAATLSEAQWVAAKSILEEAMALVPEGEVVLGQIDEALEDGRLDTRELAACQGPIVRVGSFFIDRYPVTNSQFREFVQAGGYQQVAMWDQAIWPAVLDFTDRSGQPAPRYWLNGSCEKGQEDHPVVGVTYYEASAYARWAGKRLVSDAEWVKAGSWPVSAGPGVRQQRRYPWGETMDRQLANVWGSGPAGVVAVGQYSEGVSVGGVFQLIGNVWEWTSGNYRGPRPGEDLILPVPMKTIRGGAYDTYFDNQATCHFASGENPMSRKHNIGFRCAIGLCDLTLTRTSAARGAPQSPCPEEAMA